jgi:hypothetical protein
MASLRLPTARSVIGGLVCTLLDQLLPALREPLESLEPQPATRRRVELPSVGRPPKKRSSDAAVMSVCAATIHELLMWTEQCMIEFKDNIPWNDNVLDVLEIEGLLPRLRVATTMTKLDLCAVVPFRVQDTSLYAILFVVETRLHLFCYEREWLSTDADDFISVRNYPSIQRFVPPMYHDLFLFAPISSMRGTAVAIVDQWCRINTGENREVGVGALISCALWLFGRCALLLNRPYDEEIMDEEGYVQEIEDGTFTTNLDFLNAMSAFFVSLASDLRLNSGLAECTSPPPPSTPSRVANHAALVHCLRRILLMAAADDLVNKFAKNYCEVETLCDFGGALRVESLPRLDFQKYKTIDDLFDEFLEAEPRMMRNALWVFALSYMLEQQHGDTLFVQHVFFPRLDPRKLTPENLPAQHPIICRVPISNAYVVVYRDGEEGSGGGSTRGVGPFNCVLDAFLTFLDVLATKFRCRLRHQRSGLWVDLSAIQRKIDLLTNAGTPAVPP